MKQATLLVVNSAASAVRISAGLLVGLLTTPILLRQMGPEGFGLLVTVGASGLLFVMVTETLQVSVARELAFSLGTKRHREMEEAFASAFVLQAAAGVLVTGLGVLLAPWLVQWLTIPDDEHRAVFWSLLFVFAKLGGGILVAAYGGLMAAHQDLRIKSLFDFFQRLISLLAAGALYFLPGDRLLVYVAVGFALSLLLWIVKILTCITRYPEAVPQFALVNRKRIGSMIGYGSIAFVGRMSAQLRMQGVSIYYNIVFGNLVAAANGVALRLGGLTRQFLGVLIPVIQPALTTRTGASDATAVRRLVALTSGLSLALSLCIALPIVADAEMLLTLWLGSYPAYSPLFVRCFCLSIVFTQLSAGHNLAVHARGDIGGLVLGNQILVMVPVFAAAVFAWMTHSRPWLVPVAEASGMLLAIGVFQPLWAGRKLGISYPEWLRESAGPFLLMLAGGGGCAGAARALMAATWVRPFCILAGSVLVCAAVCWWAIFDARERRILGKLTVDTMRRARNMVPSP